MKKLIVLAVAALVAAPAFADNMKWDGSAGWRYTSASHNDGLGTSTGNGDTSKQNYRAHHFRANLGVSGGWKDVEYGVGLRTQNAANTDWVTAGSNGMGRDFTIGLELAWFRYGMGSQYGDWGFTFGRQMNAFAYDKYTQNFFDNDVRFDGASLAWKWGSFGVNAAYYILGGVNQGTAGGSSYTYTAASQAAGTTTSYLSTLSGVQPTLSWKFRDNIETMVGVGYYTWNKLDGQGLTNAVHGAGANGDTATGDTGNVTFTKAKQWQVYNTWSLPYNLGFSWEYVTNKAKPMFGTSTVETDGNSFAAGLTYGAIKKAHDFKVGVAYGSKDLGSVINAFSNNRFLADNKGEMITVDYALADNFNLGWKGYFLKEKSKKAAATGLALTTAQEQKTNLWELTAGVMF